MSGGRKKWEKRKAAKKALDAIFQHRETVNVIHYSCEALSDQNRVGTPRITSIVVRDLGSGQPHSFSIHLTAEQRRVDLIHIDGKYDELERLMLDDFYKFVRDRLHYKWVHWAMRDITYGFLAIDHRYRALDGVPTQIPDAQLFDLSAKLAELHGPDYADTPRLQGIMNLNPVSKTNFLSGPDEAKAFNDKQFVNLHRSTLKKVEVITHIAELEWEGKLKTKASWREEYGTSVEGIFEVATDHWLFKLLGIIGIIASIIGALALIPH
jgi:hypothetical protein